MTSFKKHTLWVVIIIFLLCIIAVSYSYYLVSCDHNTYIKNGFSTKLKDMLKNHYELSIPDDAVFMNGYYDNAFRDPTVNITFKIPKDKTNSLLISNWSSVSLSQIDGNGKGYVSGMSYNKEIWTNIYFKKEVNGYVEITFMGGNPGNSIK